MAKGDYACCEICDSKQVYVGGNGTESKIVCMSCHKKEIERLKAERVKDMEAAWKAARAMGDSEELRKQIIKRWGSDAEFYQELKRFIEQHQNAQCSIDYDNELQLPIRAVYTFPPIQVAWEHMELMRKLQESANEVHRKEKD